MPCLAFTRARVVPLLQDFTLDGQVWNDVEDVEYEDAPDAFRDNLLYVAGERDFLGQA